MSQHHSECLMQQSVSDAKIAAISNLLMLCERATINLNESLTNAVKAAIIICLKFVDKEQLFTKVLPDTFIDWEYVKGQCASASASSSFLPTSGFITKMRGRNLLGDSSVWLQLMQFIDFGEMNMPERVMQKSYPPLFGMYIAVMSHLKKHPASTPPQQQQLETPATLNFSDVCKLLLLNNVEGLTSRSIIEMHTSSKLNQNTYTLCSNIVSTLADERHASEVYLETFRSALSSACSLLCFFFLTHIPQAHPVVQRHEGP